MVEISFNFSRFSEKINAIQPIPTNHGGTHAIESLPFVFSQKPAKSGLQNFVLINPHNRVERKQISIVPTHLMTNSSHTALTGQLQLDEPRL